MKKYSEAYAAAFNVTPDELEILCPFMMQMEDALDKRLPGMMIEAQDGFRGKLAELRAPDEMEHGGECTNNSD